MSSFWYDCCDNAYQTYFFVIVHFTKWFLSHYISEKYVSYHNTYQKNMFLITMHIIQCKYSQYISHTYVSYHNVYNTQFFLSQYKSNTYVFYHNDYYNEYHNASHTCLVLILMCFKHKHFLTQFISFYLFITLFITHIYFLSW